MFNVDKDSGLTLVELAEGLTVDDIKAATGSSFAVADPVSVMGQ